MLTPADRALTTRDPGLPGLRVLLDDAAVADLLRPVVGSVQVYDTYLRYKPHTSATLGFRLRISSGHDVWCVARCYGQHAQPKLDKDLARAPHDHVLAVQRDLGVLITTMAADRDLPGIRRALDPEGLRRALSRPSGVVPSVQPLRYNPGRRLVIAYDDATHQPLVVRVTPPGRVPTGYDRFAAAGLNTPRPVWRHSRLGLLAVEWVPGQTLHSALAADGHRIDVLADTGEMLADLHRGQVVGLPAAPRETWAPAQEAARHIATLLPDTAETSSAVLDALQASSPSTRHTPLHGDFSADQVVIGRNHSPRLIDLDAVQYGDPVVDLANARASWWHDETVGVLPAGFAEKATAAVLEGYARRADPPDQGLLDMHTAAHVLRRAVEPFRRRLTDWPDHTRTLLQAAYGVLPERAGIGSTQ